MSTGKEERRQRKGERKIAGSKPEGEENDGQ
jgi:hypothetical protein